MNPSPSPLVVNLVHERKRMANILASLNLFISQEGDFSSAQGPLHPNAVKSKILHRYQAEGGSLTGKAAGSMADYILKRFHSALVKAKEIARANNDSAS